MKRVSHRLFNVFVTGSLVMGLSACGSRSKAKGASETPRLIDNGQPVQEVPAKDGNEKPANEAPAGGNKAPVEQDKTPIDTTPLNPEKPAAPTPGGTPTVPQLPEGMPPSGTVFNVPIEPGTGVINLGRFWNVLLPPRYHVISYATNKTFEGPSTIEYGQVMDDPLTRSPFCDPGYNENGQIITIPDGLGAPHSYCIRYFNSETAYRFLAGPDRGLNHVEFSSPAQIPATYERYYFASRDIRDPEDTGNEPLTRFDAFCASNYNEGEISMPIINNWWNDPISPRPVRVRWCQTQLGGGFAGAIDVWVAGFFFEENNGASNNAAQASVEMTFVASATGIPGSFRPDVFLRGAALRVRAMLVQTGLNAPFNNFTP